MMFEHLARSDRLGASVGLERQHLIVETLFSFGVYSWYRDLAVFAERACDTVRDSGELSRCMLADRSRYVATSRLFGDVHTFGLVRGIKAVSALLRQRLPEDRRRHRSEPWHWRRTARALTACGAAVLVSCLRIPDPEDPTVPERYRRNRATDAADVLRAIEAAAGRLFDAASA